MAVLSVWRVLVNHNNRAGQNGRIQMMIRATAALAAVALGATIVYAQNFNAIKIRQDAMKSMGNAAKEPGAMMKGNAPFDLGKLQASLKTIEDVAREVKSLFPTIAKRARPSACLSRLKGRLTCLLDLINWAWMLKLLRHAYNMTCWLTQQGPIHHH